MALFSYNNVAYCEDTDCGTGKLTQYEGCTLNEDLEHIDPKLKKGSAWQIIGVDIRGVDFAESSRISFYRTLDDPLPIVIYTTIMLNPTRLTEYMGGPHHLLKVSAVVAV